MRQQFTGNIFSSTKHFLPDFLHRLGCVKNYLYPANQNINEEGVYAVWIYYAAI